MFSKILVANRGEIAVRIMRTAREMGVAAVAVYSEADEDALHVLNADEAVFLGESDPASSYLNIEKIIEAARRTGAGAIHPGYGFLAENPAFAQAVADAGLAFIGPPAEVMAKLGDKTEARRLMAGSGVPIIPGQTSPESDPARLMAVAEELGFPVLVKAAAGGGGKGMRVVDRAEDMAEAAEQAAGEAKSAFGDGSIYLEKYLDRPRHVEIQILADTQGNAVHLFERECSIQRRHQKIIEETPSPAVDHDLRRRMGEAAVAAAKASGYVNAGTVEFLLDESGEFYFLEVNTRLQVEHPITEMITGLDIVRHQLEIAAGQPLPFTQDELARRGHAIECRIYAEDPENGFMPSPGRVLYMRDPTGPGVRYESGLYTGFEVPVHYDPILGKLVVWAEDRPAAVARMIRALEECVILGVKTPIEFLIDILSSEPFRSGETHTGFIDSHFAEWRPSAQGDEMAVIGFVADELTGPKETVAAAGGREDAWPSPWQTLGAWDMGR
ncbi:MAG: acetyl-CoA carboxylase biotin carboxylase subunit [Thermodesulfobacteriota bacterium]|nr:acetyl-CoA carboxylase biotin carboxylase subunit [Thermodesulfobacteriota bacterium]